jgi:drug/metabolite transporter (DMT)-like permease
VRAGERTGDRSVCAQKNLEPTHVRLLREIGSLRRIECEFDHLFHDGNRRLDARERRDCSQWEKRCVHKLELLHPPTRTETMRTANPSRATGMLVLATAFWGLSFPTMKGLGLLQAPLLPDSSSWFVATLCLTYRFLGCALIMLVLCARTLRHITWLEIWQGVGLGIFAAGGLIFQMDGLAYTSASTSAFLTQFYCLIIPVWVALCDRRMPSLLVIACSLMVIIGVSILSSFDWRNLHLGRGELETIIGSIIFTGQILWLQRPKFARNNVNHFSLVMFAVIALCCFPIAMLTTEQARDWIVAYQSPSALAFLVILIFFCTLGGYGLMNAWQPYVTATQAGLIYCAEPVFASLFALFLPGLFSTWASIPYPNEQLGFKLLIGGGLITLANALIQLQPASGPKAAPEITGTHPGTPTAAKELRADS